MNNEWENVAHRFVAIEDGKRNLKLMNTGVYDNYLERLTQEFEQKSYGINIFPIRAEYGRIDGLNLIPPI